MMVGELNFIDISNLERFEVIEYADSQRLARPELGGAALKIFGLPKALPPGVVIWRG
jgi:hypothetical protein